MLRPLLYQLDMGLLEVLVDKLRVQPPDEVIEDTVTFIKDIAEATQQARRVNTTGRRHPPAGGTAAARVVGKAV